MTLCAKPFCLSAQTDTTAVVISADSLSINHVWTTDDVGLTFELPEITEIQADEFAVWYLKGDISQYKPLTLPPEQVFNVYVGLKQRDIYHEEARKAKSAVAELNNLVHESNAELQKSISEIISLNQQIKEKTSESEKKAEEIAKLKEQQKRFGIGPAIIYGFGNEGFGGFIGVGIHYDLIRF
jgi:hypothetical protein